MATILECLNEVELPEDVHGLALSTAHYTFCPECGHVDPEAETRMNRPCSTCGRSCECRRVLFAGDEARLIEMIYLAFRSEALRPLCLTVCCSLVEQHLRSVLIARCRRLQIDWLVIGLLLDKYRYFDDRIKLFTKLTGVTPKEIFSATEACDLFERYDELQKQRNRLSHGFPSATYTIEEADVHLAVRLAADSFSAFAYLHDKYCSVDGPSMSNLHDLLQTGR